MANKDEKPSLLETLAFLAIAAVVVVALFKLIAEFWKWATTTRRRAWVCVPVLLWPLVFVPVQIIGILLMSMTGLANFSDLNPPTDEQQFVNSVDSIADGENIYGCRKA